MTSRLSDFELLQRLGKGSFGEVYKVRRKADGRFYCLKRMNIAGLSGREQQQAINEVQIMARLESEFVVRYMDSFIDRDELCIVMELCEGGDVQQMLKRYGGLPIPEPRIWSVFLQITLGMAYLHSMRTLHRDLKGANVFLTADGRVKIGDLGVARVLGTESYFAKTCVGTPYYLSPELCEDQPYNEKSDMWALGVMLYELCTGRHPFDARNQGALILKIIQGKYPPVPDTYSEALRGLVQQLLSRDSRRRPSALEVLAQPHVLDKLLELHLPLPPELQAVLDQQRAAEAEGGAAEAVSRSLDLTSSASAAPTAPTATPLQAEADAHALRMFEAHSGGGVLLVALGGKGRGSNNSNSNSNSDASRTQPYHEAAAAAAEEEAEGAEQQDDDAGNDEDEAAERKQADSDNRRYVRATGRVPAAVLASSLPLDLATAASTAAGPGAAAAAAVALPGAQGNKWFAMLEEAAVKGGPPPRLARPPVARVRQGGFSSPGHGSGHGSGGHGGHGSAADAARAKSREGGSRASNAGSSNTPSHGLRSPPSASPGAAAHAARRGSSHEGRAPTRGSGAGSAAAASSGGSAVAAAAAVRGTRVRKGDPTGGVRAKKVLPLPPQAAAAAAAAAARQQQHSVYASAVPHGSPQRIGTAASGRRPGSSSSISSNGSRGSSGGGGAEAGHGALSPPRAANSKEGARHAAEVAALPDIPITKPVQSLGIASGQPRVVRVHSSGSVTNSSGGGSGGPNGSPLPPTGVRPSQAQGVGSGTQRLSVTMLREAAQASAAGRSGSAASGDSKHSEDNDEEEAAAYQQRQQQQQVVWHVEDGDEAEYTAQWEAEGGEVEEDVQAAEADGDDEEGEEEEEAEAVDAEWKPISEHIVTAYTQSTSGAQEEPLPSITAHVLPWPDKAAAAAAAAARYAEDADEEAVQLEEEEQGSRGELLQERQALLQQAEVLESKVNAIVPGGTAAGLQILRGAGSSGGAAHGRSAHADADADDDEDEDEDGSSSPRLSPEAYLLLYRLQFCLGRVEEIDEELESA